MFYRRFRAPSKPVLFAFLMGLSGLCAFMPADLLSPIRMLTQVIALPQWAVQQARNRVTEPLENLGSQPLTLNEQAELRQKKTALENENCALRQQIEELEQTVSQLTLLRQHQFPANGVLIPAPVIALDAAPRRDSLLIGKGNLGGVKQEDWVASRMFVRAGAGEGVPNDAPVLARECLIGKIEYAASLTSRVVLLSDPYSTMPLRVRILHFDPVSQQYLQVIESGRMASFALRGAGGGRMIMPDVRREFIDRQLVAVGDLVTSDPEDPKLPIGLVIGEIRELQHNKIKPHFYDAIVYHRFDPKSISQVFVVDLSRDTEGASDYLRSSHQKSD